MSDINSYFTCTLLVLDDNKWIESEPHSVNFFECDRRGRSYLFYNCGDFLYLGEIDGDRGSFKTPEAMCEWFGRSVFGEDKSAGAKTPGLAQDLVDEIFFADGYLMWNALYYECDSPADAAKALADVLSKMKILREWDVTYTEEFTLEDED